jgi:transcriptional regulator with XRE-family HTH domain
MVTPEQIKAARALLRMEQEELARRAGVSVTTIRRVEAADREYAVAEDTAAGVQNALQEAGIEFIHEGVRRIRKETDPKLVADLMKIAEESARLLKDAPPFTEDDLYDENGLPA